MESHINTSPLLLCGLASAIFWASSAYATQRTLCSVPILSAMLGVFQRTRRLHDYGGLIWIGLILFHMVNLKAVSDSK